MEDLNRMKAVCQEIITLKTDIEEAQGFINDPYKKNVVEILSSAVAGIGHVNIEDPESQINKLHEKEKSIKQLQSQKADLESEFRGFTTRLGVTIDLDQILLLAKDKRSK